jgi:hypothetical protein
MKKHIPFFLGLILSSTLLFPLVTSALDLGTLDLTNVTPETVAAFFKPSLSYLSQKKIAIKVLTPSFIPFRNKGTLYAIPFTDSSRPERTDRYEICLNYKPKVDSPSDCDYIVLIAEKFGFKYPDGRVDVLPLSDDLALEISLYSEVPLNRRYSYPPTYVTLSNGKRATFARLLKHTNANLSWDDNGVRYLILMKDGEKEEMLKIANSIYK